MVIRALLEGSINGVGKYHRTPIFPCGIFQYKKGVNDKPGTPNYDLFQLALESTSKRLYPNYCNCDWEINLAGNKYDREQKKLALTKLDGNAYTSLWDWLTKFPDYQIYLALEPTEKNGKKKIVVKSAEEYSPYEITSTMGCRTYNGYDINCDSDYFVKLFEDIAKTGKVDSHWLLSANQKDGRGNICPVTIILPTIAMEIYKEIEKELGAKTVGSQKLIEAFMDRLAFKIEQAKDMLLERFNWICSQSPSSATFVWENNTMAGYVKEEGIRSALSRGSLAVGQLGLAEALQILIGTDHTTEYGMQIARRIEGLFNSKCAEYKKQYHLNFGVYYTPAENLCYTALKKFREQYGVIPNVSDKEFFTNSIHTPVWKEITAFEKIDIESNLTGYSNAGCITYVELPSTVNHNMEALETIVDYAMKNDIPYMGINIPVDFCRDCHATGEFGEACSTCGSENIERLRRVTGYLTGDYKSAFNLGKQDETEHRVKHIKTIQ